MVLPRKLEEELFATESQGLTNQDIMSFGCYVMLSYATTISFYIEIVSAQTD